MCFDAIRLAADTRGLSASQKLVLLCLADYAQEKDMKAWPSVSVIAEWTGLNRKSVIQAVKFLEDEGFLMVKKENGKGNVYTLLTHTKNGTRTKIGTSAKNGMPPVPKTGLDQYQNWDTNLLRTNKEPITTSSASLSTQPEERSLFSEIKSKRKSNSLSKPDDVSQQTWDDFLAIRKAKRAPLTETALNRIRIEAEKAGISLETALATSCARGWQSFKASWIKDSYNGKSPIISSELSSNPFLKPSGEA